MTDQSPQLSHEQARDPEAQQLKHEPAPESSESAQPVKDDGAHESEIEPVDKEGEVEVKDTKSQGSNDGKASEDGDQDETDGEEEEDDEDEDEEDDDEDEDEDDDEDDDDEEDEDEEPKLKYARLTQHLNGVYRNGDATSAFLVAGDKMVGSLFVGSEQHTNVKIDRWNA
jgi:hypothetical protein